LRGRPPQMHVPARVEGMGAGRPHHAVERGIAIAVAADRLEIGVPRDVARGRRDAVDTGHQFGLPRLDHPDRRQDRGGGGRPAAREGPVEIGRKAKVAQVLAFAPAMNVAVDRIAFETGGLQGPLHRIAAQVAVGAAKLDPLLGIAERGDREPASHRTTPRARISAIVAASIPAEPSTSSVCSPYSGAWRGLAGAACPSKATGPATSWTSVPSSTASL